MEFNFNFDKLNKLCSKAKIIVFNAITHFVTSIVDLLSSVLSLIYDKTNTLITRHVRSPVHIN